MTKLPLSDIEKVATFDLPSHEKIKRIPRKALTFKISSQSVFRGLIKNGLKLKSLNFDLPKETSLIKRYTRYCKSSFRLQTSLKQEKDDTKLKKIHHKVQYLKSLQIDGIMENKKAQKNIKRFLRQSKHLQSYKTLPNPVFFLRNHVSTERNIQFVFNLKKTTNCINYNRPQRMITALSRSLRSLVSINGNQGHITLEINISTDPQSETFSDDIQKLNRGLKRINFLDNITIPLNLRDEVHHFLPLFKVRDLKVRTHYDLALITKEKCRKLTESFLSRKSAKLVIWPSSYSWSNFMEMLNLSQRMREKNGSCLDFIDFLYDFHSPVEIRQALMNHLSETNATWENFIVTFKTNSLDWFNKEKRASLQEMMETLLKGENLMKCHGITFRLHYVNEFSNELLLKILTEIGSVILHFLQSVKNKELKFTLIIDTQGIWDENILSFLAHFQEAKNSINLFQLKGISKEVSNIAWKLGILQRGESIYYDESKDFLTVVREEISKTEELKSEIEKIRDHLIQFQQADCFEIINIEQLDKLEDLRSGLRKVEADRLKARQRFSEVWWRYNNFDFQNIKILE